MKFHHGLSHSSGHPRFLLYFAIGFLYVVAPTTAFAQAAPGAICLNDLQMCVPINDAPQTAFAAPPAPATKCLVYYFGASWCGPCHVYRPTVETIVASYSAAYKYIDVDQSPVETAKYKVGPIPHVMAWRWDNTAGAWKPIYSQVGGGNGTGLADALRKNCSKMPPTPTPTPVPSPKPSVTATATPVPQRPTN